MSTKLNQRTKAAIKKWCKEQNINVIDVRHIHPRVYTMGHVSVNNLIVALPWVDSEPQCRDFDRENPLSYVQIFDRTLKAGDWCAMAYVQHSGGNDLVAIPAVV